MERSERLDRKQIFDIIQIGQDSDLISRGFDVVLVVMILLNLFIAILDTFDISKVWQNTIGALELVTVVFFTGEYLLRVWTADYLYPDQKKGRARLSYVLSFSGIIDLLSFFPYYLPVFFPGGTVAFRMFRVVRILRLFRINAYYDALNVITDVIKKKKNQILSSVFMILVLMVASSLCMYSIEHEAQPENFNNAFSAFWWSVATLFTIGYGDIYPITVAGKIFSIIITFLGVGMVAIPTGIISAGFVEEYAELSKEADRAKRSTMIQDNILVLKLDGEYAKWIGRRLAEVMLPDGMSIAMVRRKNGDLVLPQLDVKLEKGDVLIVYDVESPVEES